jgi:hypothetical protein
MGQGGNVAEWEETAFSLVNDSSSFARGYRGGFWYFNSSLLSTPERDSIVPTSGLNNIGFRVASIPEPSSALLAASIFPLLAGRRSRRQSNLERAHRLATCAHASVAF